MSNQTIDEVSEILEYIMENNSVPRNIREAAQESNTLLKDESQDQSVKISTVLTKLDEISNDPNIPVHARTFNMGSSFQIRIYLIFFLFFRNS